MGYKGFISGINTQVGGLLSKLLATASQTQSSPSNPAHHEELNRRKTDPFLVKKLSQPEITPLHIAASPFPGGSSNAFQGPSPGRRPTATAALNTSGGGSGGQETPLVAEKQQNLGLKQFDPETEERNGGRGKDDDLRSESGSSQEENDESGSSCAIV